MSSWSHKTLKQWLKIHTSALNEFMNEYDWWKQKLVHVVQSGYVHKHTGHLSLLCVGFVLGQHRTSLVSFINPSSRTRRPYATQQLGLPRTHTHTHASSHKLTQAGTLTTETSQQRQRRLIQTEGQTSEQESKAAAIPLCFLTFTLLYIYTQQWASLGENSCQMRNY